MTRPAGRQIDRFLDECGERPHNYAAIGASRRPEVPPGFRANHFRAQIGQDVAAFHLAREALSTWRHFPPWVRLCGGQQRPSPGVNVATLVCCCGIWVLAPCRVVEVTGAAGEVDEFAFSYGTLQGHPLQGEERFALQRRRDDDSVWYEVRCFFRPSGCAARLGRPAIRWFQRRFAQDSPNVLRSLVTPDELR